MAGAELDILKIPGPGRGRDRNFFYCRGRDMAGIRIFSLPGPGSGRDRNSFYCRGRAGTGKIENVGAGPGSEFFLLPGPGRDLIFL